jgi:acyl-coenzyme A synthetase/AMP-(fatty) acid ligase
MTNRFANVLAAGGIVPGDRVAVLLPQSPETAIAHIAAFKAGLVSVCLFAQLGDEELQHRLSITLCANISETVLVPLNNEQGEKEKGSDEREFSWGCAFRGFG